MHKIKQKQWIGLIIFALIAVLSMTVVANAAGSAKSKFSKACIKELDEQKNDAELLAASSLGLSVAVGLIPGDASSGISNKLADVSGYLLIIPFLVLFVYVYLSKAVLGVTFNDKTISVEKLSKLLEKEKYESEN